MRCPSSFCYYTTTDRPECQAFFLIFFRNFGKNLSPLIRELFADFFFSALMRESLATPRSWTVAPGHHSIGYLPQNARILQVAQFSCTTQYFNSVISAVTNSIGIKASSFSYLLSIIIITNYLLSIKFCLSVCCCCCVCCVLLSLCVCAVLLCCVCALALPLRTR